MENQINRQMLKELVNYFTKLKKNNIINEDQFSKLVILACKNYIENEIEIRISKSLNNKIINFFEKITTMYG